MNGFHDRHTEASMLCTTDDTRRHAAQTRDEIMMHVARGERLRAAAITQWAHRWAETAASLWHRPGRLIAKPLA